MKRGWSMAAVAVVAAAASGALAGPAAAIRHAPPPGIRILAQRGFGDSANGLAWSMAWFKGKLYVGTGRLEACVEKITIDYYLRVSGAYNSNPQPGVRCPANPYDMDLRAEIWQYTPRTGHWRMVYRAPADVRNPRARGKKVARDIAFRGMVVYRGRLYAGGVTADEYIPELKLRHPPRMLATGDGRHWRPIPARKVVVRGPRGPARPIGFRAMQVWKGRMFVTLTPALTGDGSVFEVLHPDGRRPRFRQVSPTDLAIFEMQRFGNALYIGTGDRNAGYGVYKGTLSGRRVHFRPIVTSGAGRGPTVTSVVSMHPFRNQLYVGSSGWYVQGGPPISELIRIDRRGRWQVVAGATRTVYGVTRAPISGLGDGFGNIFSAHFWRMVDYQGALYVGTNDWSWLVQKAFPALPWWEVGVIQSALAFEYGFDLWATCNGADFFPVTRDAFTGNMYDFGARNLVPSRTGLYIGSANNAQGLSVFHQGTGSCASGVHERVRTATARSAAVQAPRQVLTDVQRHGTVVSWQASAGATSYRVERAAYQTVPLAITPPPVMPDGFPPEDALPDVVAPGTPGATDLQAPVQQDYRPIGTARGTAFVDRSASPGGRYAYRVVAVGPAGRSAPSAIQVVPDPRPVPTFGRLRRLVGTATAQGRMATAATTRHDRGAQLRILARLQRATAPGSDAGLLIERLQRRIRYAGLAGGH